MPKKEHIRKVLVIGSGPIVIGQAAEFDYAGAQACQSLREEGVQVVLINANPATIMTDEEMADRVYIEPLTMPYLLKVIEKERPDALLPGMGGQTALNLALELHDQGILEKYQIEVLGTSIDAIKKGEDRELFRQLMEKIGEPVIESVTVKSIEEAKKVGEILGYPVVVRPAYTLGGAGGGICEDEESLVEVVRRGLQLSRVHEVLLEKCVRGWKEIEFEAMRDGFGNAIAICSMENIDPVGIHTGDSMVVAPALTLTDQELQMLRRASLNIVDAVGIEGGCNVQFALDPHSFTYAVIEINPRVSRSSALASKATGYPIAKVSTKIALGYGLHEIQNALTRKTTAAFEPVLDYVVVKLPKWPFDKFYTADRTLGTKMMATGEVMAMGDSFESAFLKGLRGLEIGQYGLVHEEALGLSLTELKERVHFPSDERMFYLAELIRRGYSLARLEKDTGIQKFFLKKIQGIVQWEEALQEKTFQELTREELLHLKKKGFSDKGIGDLLKVSPNEVYELRMLWGIKASYKMVDTSSGEFEAVTPYYYATYDEACEVVVTKKRKVMVIGSGPIRIGQGIEFDYCSVHGVKALKKMGIETIMVNNNPETVSTDFDVADKLYFEPLTEEDTYEIYALEKPEGVILQFGGQTAIKLAAFLQEKGVPILGTSPEDIHHAEDREAFEEVLQKLQILRPQGKGVWHLQEGLAFAKGIGYPVLVRPSYVLGGQGMEVCHGEDELRYYLGKAFAKDQKYPVLIDAYIEGMELEMDALFDGEDILIPGIMEHLEQAGVHSGDSISIYPGIHIKEKIKEDMVCLTKSLAKELGILGLMNLQFILKGEELYLIEVNPRSSRTVPYISKVTGLPMIEMATRILLGEKLREMPYGVGLYPEPSFVSVKVPVFSTEKLPQVEASLGPEMRSTGEVLGIGKTFQEALFKGLLAAGMDLQRKKRKVLVTLKDQDKERFLPLAKKMQGLGYLFYATEKTAQSLQGAGVEASCVHKLGEESPSIVDIMGEKNIDLVFNTPTKGNDAKRDGFLIRRAAVENSVELVTSLSKAEVLVELLHGGLLEEETDSYPLGSYGVL